MKSERNYSRAGAATLMHVMLDKYVIQSLTLRQIFLFPEKYSFFSKDAKFFVLPQCFVIYLTLSLEIFLQSSYGSWKAMEIKNSIF